jgi:tight adherence protein B
MEVWVMKVLRIIVFIALNIGFFTLIFSNNRIYKSKKWEEIAREMTENKKLQIKDKELNKYEKFRLKSSEVLKLSNTKLSYNGYLKCIGLFSIIGVVFGLMLNNVILSIILAIGMGFLPFWYLELKKANYENHLNEQIEIVLGVITNSYMTFDDITTAIKNNIEQIEMPMQAVFQDFITSKTFIDNSNVKNIRRMKEKVNNGFFKEWCDILILCQDDRQHKQSLPPIVKKMADVRQISEELSTIMYAIYKDHISVTIVVLVNIPLMQFLNKEWYVLLTKTLIGQIIVALTFVVVFFATYYVIKVNKAIGNI